ncbi:MAG: multicopper oxidase family protein [Polyangiaceae bacterium]
MNLTAQAHDVQLADGKPTAMLTYNDQLPGPLLHARVGDRIIVHFTNALDEETTVHWHGLRISDQMDGSPMIQSPIPPGGTFTYDFVVPDAGTFWYHTHLHQIQQFEKGLYGAIVVHEKDAPAFTAERLFVADDIRLTATNAIAPFQTSGPDIGMGRVGNTLVMNGRAEPLKLTIPRGAVERWRFILATNSLAYGLQFTGADVSLIATDGGLLPAPIPRDRVEVAPGQRYEFEVRPKADATEVKLEAMILELDANDMVVEVPFEIAHATVEGDVTPTEPVYPAVVLPATDVQAETFDWKLSGANVGGKVEFTINGESTFVGDGTHAMLGMFEQGKPVKIRFTSMVSPAHPFHLHGQFFQILERNGEPVTDEPGLRDTVHVRGADSVTILTYFENPGEWMVHCHISEHSEKGMMGEIMVHASGESQM